MSVYQYELRHEIIDQMVGESGFLLVTPDGNYAVSGFSVSSIVDQYGNDYFNQWWGHCYSGTNAGSTFRVSDYVDATGLFTTEPDMSSAFDSTSLIELSRDYHPQEVNRRINMALRRVEKTALQGKVDRSIIVDDLMTDPRLETWTDASNLTNYSTGGTGTLTREATIKIEGSYAAKLVNTAGNAFYIYQSIDNPGLYAGQTAYFKGRAHALVADRVRLKLYDGVNTHYSSYHDGKGWRESEGFSGAWLEIDGITIADNPTELTLEGRIESGTSITAYFDKFFFACGDKVLEYDVPSGFVYIHTIIQESAVTNRFNDSDEVDPRGWGIKNDGATPTIWFDPSYVSLKQGRKLHLGGYARPAQLSSDSDSTDVDPTYIVQQCVARMHQALVSDDEIGSYHLEQVKLAQTLADEIREELVVTPEGKEVFP